MSQRSVHTIWCDDIRQELGNKPSFMGVYTGGIVLLGLPTVLPRLGVWTSVRSPADRPIREVSVRVERDDGTILLELPKGAVLPAGVQPAGEHATSQVLMFGATIALVEVPAGCRHFQVMVCADGEELPGPKLWVEVNPEMLAEMMP